MSFSISNFENDKTLNQTISLLQNYLDSFDIGDYKFSNSSSDKGNWLLCDGRILLKSEYPELFNVISTNYGTTNIQNFKLPDFRGKIFGYIGNGHVPGDYIGSETVTLTINEIPTHTHSGTTELAGSHNHTATTSSDGIHTHTSNSVTNLGMVTKNGSGTPGSIDNSGSEINCELDPTPLIINNSGSHSHTLTTNTEPDHTHTFTSQSTGGGQPHSNMQPTLFGGNVFILSKHLSLKLRNNLH